MSMFTGLYPAEHGVFPPSRRPRAGDPHPARDPPARRFPHRRAHRRGLRPGRLRLRARLRRVDRHAYADDTDVERTFGRGVAFLKSVKPGERFFLFLHTLHRPRPLLAARELSQDVLAGAAAAPAPASPPARTSRRSTTGSPRPRPKRSSTTRRSTTPRSATSTIACAQLFADLEASGLAGETTVLLTADHGEEFLEHGKLVHTQIYPECLHIPLIVVHPAQREGRASAGLAQTIDFAPTIYDLAGGPAAGRALGQEPEAAACARPERALSGEAYAEVKVLRFDGQALFAERDGKLLQATLAAAVMESDGHWVSEGDPLRRPAAGARVPRRGLPSAARGRRRSSTASRRRRCSSRPTGRASASSSPASARKHRVSLTTAGCDSPLALGVGNDGRCLSFKLYGPPLERRELFDLTRRSAGGARPLDRAQRPAARDAGAPGERLRPPPANGARRPGADRGADQEPARARLPAVAPAGPASVVARSGRRSASVVARVRPRSASVVARSGTRGCGVGS